MKSMLSVKSLTPRRITRLGFGFLILIIALQVFFVIQQKKQVQQSREMVEHSYAQIHEIEKAITKLRDMEASQLNFLLTGQDKYLNAYWSGVDLSTRQSEKKPNEPLQDVVRNLQKFYADDPDQQSDLDYLHTLLQNKVQHMAHSMDIRRQRGGPDPVDWAHLDHGKEIMDQVRAQIDHMIALEQDNLDRRIQENEDNHVHLTCMIIVAALLSYGALFAALVIITRIFAKAQMIERELHAKEEWFRAAADNSMDGFFLFHVHRHADGTMADLLLDYLNPVAQRMVQKTLPELLHKPINQVLFPENANVSTLATYRAIFERQAAMEREYTVTGGPLAGRILQKQAIPLPNGIAITCRDITERRQMEQMKTEFVSTVSHELRTPLTSIRGSLGLVTGGVAGELPDQIKSLLMIAYNNCERLVRLINDILDIEKIESGGMHFDLQPLSLEPVLQQAVKDNLAFAEKYGVSVMLHAMPEQLPDILADSDRVNQIVTNLLSNAIKFSHRGQQVEMMCSVDQHDVQIDIIDHGIGIPAVFRTKIFQKFAQADSSDTRQKSGTGLGLAITKALVEQMNGTITFDTTDGQGTVFHVCFPIAPAAADIFNAATSSALPTAGRILVCEDDPDIANLLRLILEKSNFAVDLAATAQEALSKLRTHTYAAMTLDLVLPDRQNSNFCDGLAFIQKIRDDAALRHLPIIVVSAKAEEGQQVFTGSAVGVLDWLSKPIAVDRLVAIVKDLSDGSDRPRILHVEDDKDIADVLSLSLAPLADVTHAPTIQHAKDHLQHNHFHLVILDVGLPDGQGTDLLPLLQRDDGWVTPVILFTASDVTQEISATVAATLIKSRTSEANLLDIIQQMISQNPSHT